MKKVYLGVDVGSISINYVVMDTSKEILFQSYVRASGNPIHAVLDGLKEVATFMETLPGTVVGAVCTTGSGRELTGALLGADLIKNEISAHARAALHLHPDVHTVIEIGGQDSKVTILRDGAVVDFAMNLVCAAGTGSFLDSQARRLNLSIQEFSEIAMHSENPTNIAGRCTVFAESDMIHKQQIGFPQQDIVMGLCMALARNFVGNVCRGKDLTPPYVFQGGVSANQGIKRAFESVLGHEVLIPKYHMVMGAYGAAILALEARVTETKFRGYDISSHTVETGSFTCGDCSNHCEIIEIRDGGNVIGRSGGRCNKWS